MFTKENNKKFIMLLPIIMFLSFLAIFISSIEIDFKSPVVIFCIILESIFFAFVTAYTKYWDYESKALKNKDKYFNSKN